MGVFRRHRWRRYVEGSHSSLVATDHLAARCIASVNPFSRTNQLPRAHLSANSKRSPTRSHQFQMTISTSGRSPSPLSEALVEGVASRRNIRRSLPRSADTLFARETISFHQINIAVAQPKLIAGCRRLKRFHSHGLNVWGVCRGCFSPLRHRRVRGRGAICPRYNGRFDKFRLRSGSQKWKAACGSCISRIKTAKQPCLSAKAAMPRSKARAGCGSTFA
jgi:hypothetical protein